MKDRVIEVEDGFDCIVRGHQFGTWPNRALATAGMHIEQGRAARRAPILTQEQWDEIVANVCEAY